jgi:hypothetical protein
MQFRQVFVSMDSKRKGMGMKRAGGILSLAGVLMLFSAAGWGASLNEVELTAWNTLDLSLLEAEQELHVAATTVPYVRPDRRRHWICDDCEFNLGVGGTYHSFEATGGEVIPMTVTWDRGRWEVGVFHFSEQTSSDNDENVEQLVARPYWGASVSRRFKLYERGPLRAIFGFGLSYRTETDILSATHWNFSSQLGLRFKSPQFPAIFELSARHWSNGGVRTPNRGQDFTILTVRFDH